MEQNCRFVVVDDAMTYAVRDLAQHVSMKTQNGGDAFPDIVLLLNGRVLLILLLVGSFWVCSPISQLNCLFLYWSKLLTFSVVVRQHEND